MPEATSKPLNIVVALQGPRRPSGSGGLLQEDGLSFVILEDGDGFLLLEG